MKKRILSLLLALTLLACFPTYAAAASSSFTDVNTTDWFYAPVEWAVKNNITKGISNAAFGPDVTCTRGQVVTFLWAAAGRPTPNAARLPFLDVSKNDWFYTPVLWAVENHITSGITETQFGPNEPCTRSQVVTFLWAAADRPTPTAAGAAFTDVSKSDWYYTPVLWAVENGITKGISNIKFGPHELCSRAQIVTFLYAARSTAADPTPTPAVTPTPTVTPTPAPTTPPLTPTTQEKIQISQVEISEYGDPYAMDFYIYNSDGLLAEIRRTYADSYNPDILTCFAYDSSGRMIERTVYGESEQYEVQDKYGYDSSGMLIGHIHDRYLPYPYNTITEYKYENGRLLYSKLNRWTPDSDKYTALSEYFYDAQGRLTYIKTTDTYGAEMWSYRYDAKGQLSETIYNRELSETYAVTYNYDYKPFILSSWPELGEEYDVHSAYFTDCMGHDMYSYTFSDPVFAKNSSGLVETVTDRATGRKYTIGYIESPSNDPEGNDALYASILKEYRLAADCEPDWFMANRDQFPHITSNAMESSKSRDLHYAYYDIDKNGVSELLIFCNKSSDSIIDLYTHDGSKPIKLISEPTLGKASTLTIYYNGTIGLDGRNAPLQSHIFYELEDSSRLVKIKTFSLSQCKSAPYQIYTGTLLRLSFRDLKSLTP